MASRSRGPPAPGPAVARAAVQKYHLEEEDDDLFASPPGLWLPRMVVKKHRKKATIIWILLLIGFLAYVAYIVWETVQSRKDPASSIERKQEYYNFPDVMICPSYLNGCQQHSKCATEPVISFFTGFENNSTTFMNDHAHEVVHIEEEYDLCEVIPLSRLTPNETAINNGEITAFSVLFLMLWQEELEYEFEEFIFNNQFVTLYFIDVDNDIDEIGGEIVDAKLPYARINVTTGIPYVAAINHMVMDLTEFTGINSDGNKEEKQRTFSQSTTTAPQNWLWEDAGMIGAEYSMLVVEMTIGKFEYTSIEEVDPVDMWSILGAIGGIWQFVVTGFGLFFVFSVKQAPDRKMRNFSKTIAKPAVIVNKRLSSLSSRTSNADVEIDASEEDLPMEWVKKRRPTGSIYYFNVLTGAKQGRSPNDLNGTGEGYPEISRGSAVSRIFTGDQPVVAGSPLPPGWMRRTDDTGKFYYMNTISRTAQRERPSQRVHSTGGRNGRPRVVDAPMVHMRRGSNASSVHSHHSSSSGAPTHRHSTATTVSAAASSPPDANAPPPPLGSTPAAPSYRTAVHLSNSSATAAAPAGDAHLQQEHKEEVRPAPAEAATAGGARPGPAVSVGEVHERMRLPPNWRMRTTAENRPYYENSATKQTQWEAPHS